MLYKSVDWQSIHTSNPRGNCQSLRLTAKNSYQHSQAARIVVALDRLRLADWLSQARDVLPQGRLDIVINGLVLRQTWSDAYSSVSRRALYQHAWFRTD
jgi:hypothetical protein